ncbi:MAG: calcium-binding protein, partial [Pseudomonadota bacterium]
MTIEIREQGLDEKGYKELRNTIIKVLEGKDETAPYFCSAGKITIGYGFNIEWKDKRDTVMGKKGMDLTDDQQKKINALFSSSVELQKIRNNWTTANTSQAAAQKAKTAAQKALGAAKTADEKKVAQEALTKAQTDLTQAKANLKNADTDLGALLSKTIAPTAFTMNSTQMDSALNVFADEADKAAQSLTRITKNSAERAVLASLYYNSPVMIGQGLLNALQIPDPAEARAEAWYQIRYQSGDQYKRRYVESEIFGIYKDPAEVQKADALAVYRVYTKHRLDKMTMAWDEKRKINIKDATGDLIAIAHGAPSAAKTLRDSLLPAADKIKEVYVEGLHEKYCLTIADFNPLNIQVATPNLGNLYGEDTADRTGSNDDLLIGNDGRFNYLSGLAGNDLLIGGDQNDYLEGGEGADTLVGGKGRDNMFGGDGDDTFIIEGEDTDYDIFTGGADKDTIQGGAGNDTIRLHHFTGENRVEFIDGGGGTHNIIAGTDGADIFDFSETTITNIHGIYGGGGDDIYYVNPGAPPITIEDKEDTNKVFLNGKLIKLLIKGDSSYVSPDGTFTAVMKGNNDLWVTDTENGGIVILNENFQEGDFGIQFIDEFADPETTGIIKHGDLKPIEFKDEDGNTYYKYDKNNNIIVHEDQAEAGRQDTLYGTADNDHLFGHDGNDSLQGKAGDDLLEGGSGNDFIRGDDGNDLLIGGTDSDRLFGGAGNDLLFAEEQKDIAILIQEGETGTGTGLRGDLLSGGDGDDLLISGAGDDLIVGGAGADTIISGAGDDNIDEDWDMYSATDDWYVTRTVTNYDTSTSYSMEFPNTSGKSVSGGDDSIFSGSGNDWVFSRDGNDYVDAGSENDVVFGGRGDDTLYGQSGDDILNGDSLRIPAAEHGSDYIDGGEGDDFISGLGKDDILIGGAGNDRLSGDSSVIAGEFHGKDYLDGGTGNDILYGNGDDDTLIGGDGNDELWGDDDKTAGEFHGKDSLLAGNGDDTLVGGGSDDILFGGSDDDFLWGDNKDNSGTGNDTMYGGTGYDRLYGGGGNDTVYGEEDDDFLYGQDGNDTLDGGEGEDQMYGGAGDDTYVVDIAPYDSLDYGSPVMGDIVNESADAGFDTVIASVDYTLEANVERLILSGDSNINATGNGSDNVLIGNSGVNTLSGGTGNDTLYGGEEADTLLGGVDNDIYVISNDGNIITENLGEGTDTVQ